MEYATLVSELLPRQRYPVLEEYVLLDIYYKMIPVDLPHTTVERYDRLLRTPEDVYLRDARPFTLHYLTATHPRHFYRHRIHHLDLSAIPLQCVTVKLARSFVDTTVLQQTSATFEEELYRLITFLNFDVPRIADLINFTFLASTRFCPQRIQLWVFSYTERLIHCQPVSEAERQCFGPPEQSEALPLRTLLGRLSECTSRSTLLSLNNPLEYPHLSSFLHHLAEPWQTVIPLAFNPLENPIITTLS